MWLEIRNGKPRVPPIALGTFFVAYREGLGNRDGDEANHGKRFVKRKCERHFVHGICVGLYIEPETMRQS